MKTKSKNYRRSNNRKDSFKSRDVADARTRKFDDSEEGKWDSKFKKNNPIKTNCKFNDPSWYSKNQQMLHDAASVSYNQPIGTTLHYNELVSDPGWTTSSGVPLTNYLDIPNSAKSVPGVMALVTGICPGLSKDYRSPINLAAQNIYTFVRKANSGATNYAPEDLMMYMFALDSAYSCWNFLKRAYGMMCEFSQHNWYQPKTFIESCGIDYYDLNNNLADFRLFLNVTAARLSSFCVPSTMPIFIRHSWLFSNVWLDSNNAKAQSYIFVPLYFYQYSESTNPKGGELVAKPWSSWISASTDYPSHMKPTLLSLSQVKAYMNSLIDVLYQSEDIGTMSGDILKAYGEGGLFKLTPVAEDYSVKPVYNEEVLNQIHNATILNNSYHNGGTAAGSTSVFNITQNPDTLTINWDPTFASNPTNKIGTLINMPWENVTEANTMVGTRLACTYQSTTDQNDATGTTPFATKAKFTSVGTEFVWNAFIGFMNSTMENPFWFGFKTLEEDAFSVEFRHAVISGKDNNWVSQADYLAAISNLTESRALVALLSNFDWHPLVSYEHSAIYLFYQLDGTLDHIDTHEDHKGFIGDLTNWTTVVQSRLENMNLTAVMSEFDIPAGGSF